MTPQERESIISTVCNYAIRFRSEVVPRWVAGLKVDALFAELTAMRLCDKQEVKV